MVENERRSQGVGPPFFCVPARQACVRVDAAYNRGVEHTIELDVVDEIALPLEQASVFEAMQRLTPVRG